jgi:hypothetical protein
VLNNGLWVSILLGLGTGTPVIGVVNLLFVAILELGYPFADVVTIGVKLFTLKQRVEDPKVWLRIYSNARRESLF